MKKKVKFSKIIYRKEYMRMAFEDRSIDMKKVLFAANLESFFLKFLIPQLEYFKKQGYEVHIASRSENLEIPYCDKKFDVSFARSLSIKDNVKSYRQMKKILKNEHYDIISCHTPFGAAITSLLCWMSQNISTSQIWKWTRIS